MSHWRGPQGNYHESKRYLLQDRQPGTTASGPGFDRHWAIDEHELECECKDCLRADAAYYKKNYLAMADLYDREFKALQKLRQTRRPIVSDDVLAWVCIGAPLFALVGILGYWLM